MRFRTVAAVGLLAAALTACQPSDDEATPAPTVTVTEAANANAMCLADLVEAYPDLDPKTPMMGQVEACEGLSRQEQSDVLRVLQEYDDALQAAVDAAGASS
ncbi:hypothetical protein [Streptomyces sp. NPDC057838]|uniref:hypothetical protein n=1 Tax=unclassified Streptomyces TaxID=2593676 RepID=UPI0036853A63